MADVEVFLDWQGRCLPVGLMRRHPARGRESVTFEYDPGWLASAESFSIDPGLPKGPGVFRPPAGQEMFGTLGDSAPDTWGRTLMRRRERRAAETEGRPVRTLHEIDFLLGVSDETRLGALRLRWAGEGEFQTPQAVGVPGTVALGDLLRASERILRGEETDEYSLERWEAIALDMAESCGITVARHDIIENDGRPIFLSRRFDRQGGMRIPFLSAMSMTQHRDGERGSYLEIVDALSEQGANALEDKAELFRRIAFSVLVSNTVDHLRNHGFLWQGQQGWTLSPAYDINPTPADIKPRILSTNIDFDDGTCSVELLRSVAEEFSLKAVDGDQIIGAVAEVVRNWRDFARGRGAREAEITRMTSAFEHDDLERALALS